MKTSSQTFSQSSGLDRSHVGNRPGAVASSVDLAAATAPSPTPTKPALIVKNGTISKIAHKPRRKPRIKRVPVALPARSVVGFLVVPKVLDEIEFNRRVVIVKAAIAMVLHGLSQNHAADALGVTRSRLCVWLQRYGAEGEEALRPAPWRGGRKPAKGRAQRHTAFIELQTARR